MGQRALVRNYRPGEDWTPGTVIERRSPHSYTVQVANDQVWHQHIDQLKERQDSPQEDVSKSSLDIDNQVYGTVSVPAASVTESEDTQPPQPDVSAQASTNRYLKRTHKPPERFTY